MAAYYLDEDTAKRRFIRAMRSQGLDVVSPAEVGMLHRSDDDHLALATRQGRVVYSFNVGDFSRLHAEWLQDGRSHAGILLAHQWQRHSIGIQLRGLTRLATQRSSADMQNRLEYLRDWI